MCEWDCVDVFNANGGLNSSRKEGGIPERDFNGNSMTQGDSECDEEMKMDESSEAQSSLSINYTFNRRIRYANSMRQGCLYYTRVSNDAPTCKLTKSHIQG